MGGSTNHSSLPRHSPEPQWSLQFCEDSGWRTLCQKHKDGYESVADFFANHKVEALRVRDLLNFCAGIEHPQGVPALIEAVLKAKANYHRGTLAETQHDDFRLIDTALAACGIKGVKE